MAELIQLIFESSRFPLQVYQRVAVGLLCELVRIWLSPHINASICEMRWLHSLLHCDDKNAFASIIRVFDKSTIKPCHQLNSVMNNLPSRLFIISARRIDTNDGAIILDANENPSSANICERRDHLWKLAFDRLVKGFLILYTT